MTNVRETKVGTPAHLRLSEDDERAQIQASAELVRRWRLPAGPGNAGKLDFGFRFFQMKGAASDEEEPLKVIAPHYQGC